MWIEIAVLVFLALAVPIPIIAAYFYTGNKDDLNKLQAALGGAAAGITASFIVTYILLFYWVQAKPTITIPLLLVLCFINSVISTTGLTASLLVK